METYTQWKLTAQSCSTAAEGLRGVVGLGAQLGDSGKVRPIAVFPYVQGNLEGNGGGRQGVVAQSGL